MTTGQISKVTILRRRKNIFQTNGATRCYAIFVDTNRRRSKIHVYINKKSNNVLQYSSNSREGARNLFIVGKESSGPNVAYEMLVS